MRCYPVCCPALRLARGRLLRSIFSFACSFPNNAESAAAYAPKKLLFGLALSSNHPGRPPSAKLPARKFSTLPTTPLKVQRAGGSLRRYFTESAILILSAKGEQSALRSLP